MLTIRSLADLRKQTAYPPLSAISECAVKRQRKPAAHSRAYSGRADREQFFGAATKEQQSIQRTKHEAAVYLVSHVDDSRFENDRPNSTLPTRDSHRAHRPGSDRGVHRIPAIGSRFAIDQADIARGLFVKRPQHPTGYDAPHPDAKQCSANDAQTFSR